MTRVEKCCMAFFASMTVALATPYVVVVYRNAQDKPSPPTIDGPTCTIKVLKVAP